MSRLLRGSGPEVMARLSGLALAGILVLAVGAYAALHYGWLDHGPEYKAEFTDAWPLVAGMDVRVSGAVVGSVRKVALTDEGTAEVTFQLKPGIPAPHADASVAIRQSDLLGDSDLSLSLGTAKAPLRGPIPISRSIQEPRLDDFLDIFRAPVRTALQTFIVELGTAMEDRGIDVNAAILELRPGFEALGNVFTELTGQLSSLRQVLADAHTVTSQLASRSTDLDKLVVGLQQTITGVAAQSGQLDAGLKALPATLAETGSTLGEFDTLNAAIAPLARTITAAGPGFRRAADEVGPYARTLGTAAKLATPTLRLAGDALRRGEPALQALHKTKVSTLLNPTGGLFNVLAPLLDKLASALFGTPNGVGGLGSVTSSGNDTFAPHVDPTRDYLAGYLVISCGLFGVPDTPGCLTRILSGYFGPRSAHAQQPSHGWTPSSSTSSDAKPLLHYLLGR